MNFSLPCPSPRTALRAFLSAFCVVMPATLINGCGGGNGAATTLTGNTPVTLLATSTGNDQLSELTLDITGVTLTNKEGKSVSLLSLPQYVEFMHLNGGIEPLQTANVPQDVYTSATISISHGVPLCETYDPASGGTDINSAQTAQVSNVTANLSEPITVTGTGMGLALNLQVSESTNYSGCSSLVGGAVPFSVTPTFNVTPVTFAAQPTNSTNGKASGLRGLIGAVTAGGTGFSVAGDFGAGTNAPIWQVSSNGGTVFQGITGASQLAAGMPVDMDVAIQTDGTLVATRVAVYDPTSANVSFSNGPQSYVSAAAPSMSSLAIEVQGPDFTDFGGGPTGYSFGNAAFQISGQMTNLGALPFTASFDATKMVAGQNIFVTTHALTNNGPFQAATVTLLPQTINGTVSAISTSGSFTTYTISLPAYNLFPNLAVPQGQTAVLTNPNTVVVYVDSDTQMLNTSPLAVGGVFRFSGLVFDDGGTLRMDCAQINDGVKE
jgi:hypothetical protein